MTKKPKDLTAIYNDLIAKGETVAAHHVAHAIAALGGNVLDQDAKPDAIQA